jgi:large subunit ribosomal protein L9
MSQVKVILREDVPKLGHAGEVVSVKPGYARNFLLREGRAVLASEAKVKEIEHHQRLIADQVARELKDLRAARDRLEQLELEVRAQAGEEGRLFGSVTAIQIAELIGEKGIEIDRRKIDLAEPIKEVGEHIVPIRRTARSSRMSVEGDGRGVIKEESLHSG